MRTANASAALYVMIDLEKTALHQKKISNEALAGMDTDLPVTGCGMMACVCLHNQLLSCEYTSTSTLVSTRKTFVLIHFYTRGIWGQGEYVLLTSWWFTQRGFPPLSDTFHLGFLIPGSNASPHHAPTKHLNVLHCNEIVLCQLRWVIAWRHDGHIPQFPMHPQDHELSCADIIRLSFPFLP